MAMALGGAERTTGNLLRYLDRSRISHITLVAPESLHNYFTDGYDRFIDAFRYDLQCGFINSRILRNDCINFARIIRETAPDIVLGIMHYSSALVVLGAHYSRSRVKTVASFRGPFFEYVRRYERGVRRLVFLRAVVTGTVLLADRVIVPSHGTKRELRRLLGRPKKTIVVPNGIDWKAASQLAQANVISLSEVKQEGKALLCAVARLSREKNLTLLITAFKRVHELRSVELLIVGDGPERPALEQIIRVEGLENAVTFTGHKENVFPYLHYADLFIHTCEFEGFGYAILEAMACATPVIATDCPYGPREIIGNNEYGVLVSPNDAGALADAIISLLDDKETRQMYAKRGMERAKTLSVERMVKEYERVLFDLEAKKYHSS